MAEEQAAKEIEDLQKQIEEEEKRKIAAEEEEKKTAASASTTYSEQAAADVEEQCEIHNRKLEIICIQCQTRICCNCALFGVHKGHDVRMEAEVVEELSVRTELLIQMYQIVEDISSNRVD
jgi:hypothetical protein